jgi:hypothetical protein
MESCEETSREKTSNPSKTLILWDAWRIGVLGFSLASLVVFASWAFFGSWFYTTLGEMGAYIVWLIMYLVIGCEVMKGLLPGPDARIRFYQVFSSAFAAYAILWIVVWMIFRNRQGEALAAVFGSLVMGLRICAAQGNLKQWWRLWIVLSISNLSGYFLGAWLHATLGMPWGAVAWGMAYGFLFGSGIGPAFWLARIREPLKTSPHVT